jgi:hypothetical protein
MEEWNMITNFVSNNGFAIFVAGWMLIRQSKETKALTDAVTKLTSIIEGGQGGK